jgi:DNA-binding transcriptional regulator YdaS (Cro superfamily)
VARNEIETEGRESLKKWLAGKERGAMTALADQLGVTVQLISQWCAGTCRPGPLYWDAIEVATEIRPHEWQTEEERERRRKAMRGAAEGRESEPANDDDEPPESEPRAKNADVSKAQGAS